MADNLDKIHDAGRQILGVAYMLSGLGRNFERLGMRDLAEEMIGYSQDLCNIQETISKAVGAHINEQFELTQQASRNMVEGILGIVEHCAKEEKGKEQNE